jgi:hypothetical protein
MVVPSRGEAAVFDFDRRPAIPGAPPADSARSVDRITPVIMRPAATAVSDPTKPVTASVSTDFFCNSRQASALERGNGLTALVVKQPCNVVRSQTTLAKASPPIGLTDGTFLGLQIDDVDLPQDGAEARLEFFVVGPDSGTAPAISLARALCSVLTGAHSFGDWVIQLIAGAVKSAASTTCCSSCYHLRSPHRVPVAAQTRGTTAEILEC